MSRVILKKSVQFTNQIVRYYSKASGGIKVSVCGAAGLTGQAVSVLLKSCPLIDELALYDVCSTAAIAMDLNHIDTKCKVHSYKRDVKGALRLSNIVILLAKAPSVAGIKSNFALNADIICDLTTAIVTHCPEAFIAIATRPINSMVPLVSDVMKHYGVYNSNHIFGITTLNVMRTNSVVAQKLGLFPEQVYVPCIGGDSSCTVVPILSQTKPKTKFSDQELLSITDAIQNSQSRIGEETCSTVSLSGALAISQFVISLVRALKGEQNIVETCFIKSKAYPNMPYLSTPVVLGTDGFTKNLGVPYMTDYEKCLFQTCRECLREEVQRGEDFVKSKFNLLCG